MKIIKSILLLLLALSFSCHGLLEADKKVIRFYNQHEKLFLNSYELINSVEHNFQIVLQEHDTSIFFIRGNYHPDETYYVKFNDLNSNSLIDLLDSLNKSSKSYIVDIDRFIQKQDQLPGMQKSNPVRKLEQILQLELPPKTNRISKEDSLIIIETMVDKYSTSYFFIMDDDFMPFKSEGVEYYNEIYYSDVPVEPQMIFNGRINQLVTYEAFQ
ncbi:MAG: hypothetical protein ACOCXH_09485 [Cyclobacteriaceae bacterium]